MSHIENSVFRSIYERFGEEPISSHDMFMYVGKDSAVQAVFRFHADEYFTKRTSKTDRKFFYVWKPDYLKPPMIEEVKVEDKSDEISDIDNDDNRKSVDVMVLSDFLVSENLSVWFVTKFSGGLFAVKWKRLGNSLHAVEHLFTSLSDFVLPRSYSEYFRDQFYINCELGFYLMSSLVVLHVFGLGCTELTSRKWNMRLNKMTVNPCVMNKELEVFPVYQGKDMENVWDRVEDVSLTYTVPGYYEVNDQVVTPLRGIVDMEKYKPALDSFRESGVLEFDARYISARFNIPFDIANQLLFDLLSVKLVRPAVLGGRNCLEINDEDRDLGSNRLIYVNYNGPRGVGYGMEDYLHVIQGTVKLIEDSGPVSLKTLSFNFGLSLSKIMHIIGQNDQIFAVDDEDDYITVSLRR